MGTIDAFCGDHSGRMGSACAGKTWGSKQEITGSLSKVAQASLAYYYNLIAAGTNPDGTPLSAEQVKITNAWVQAILWLDLSGKNPTATTAGKERAVVIKKIWPAQATVTGNDEAGSMDLLNMIMADYEAGKFGTNWKFYRYTISSDPYKGSGHAQYMVIGVPGDTPSPGGNEFYLTLDKMEEGTTTPLAGATFTVYEDAACTKPWTVGGKNPTFTTVAEAGHAYGSFYFPNGVEEADVWVKETKAPSGYSLNAEAASPHQVHVTKANTQTNPALVPGSPFKNEKGDDDDDHDDTITKLDARTKLPVGGATFLIRGEVFEEEIPDASGNPHVDPATDRKSVV